MVKDKEEPIEEKITIEKIKELREKKLEVEEAADFDLADLEGVGKVRRERLSEAGINNPMDLVVNGPVHVAEITGMEVDQAEKLVTTAREYLVTNNVIPKTFQKATEVYEYRKTQIDSNRISSGCKALDSLLGGGFEPQAITEFYGVYGCGKTQICHTATTMAMQPKDKGGLNGEVIWIDTENTFRPERIRDILLARDLVPTKEQSKSDAKAGLPKEPVNEKDITKFLSKITHAKAMNASHQMLIINELGELLKIEDGKKSRPVLIVVDSLTTHFRVEYTGRGFLQEKQSLLNKMIHKLIRIAETYNIAIIITNQVLSSPTGFGDPIKPVGGNVLAHASTYRVYLRKSTKTKRVARMDDSPAHAQNEVIFCSELAGVIDCAEES